MFCERELADAYLLSRHSYSAIWLTGGAVFWLRFVAYGARFIVLNSLLKLACLGDKRAPGSPAGVSWPAAAGSGTGDDEYDQRLRSYEGTGAARARSSSEARSPAVKTPASGQLSRSATTVMLNCPA